MPLFHPVTLHLILQHTDGLSFLISTIYFIFILSYYSFTLFTAEGVGGLEGEETVKLVGNAKGQSGEA